MSKSKTKAEKLHLSRVAALGCIVCRNLNYGESPAEIHHCSSGTGLSVRADNFHVIPLCHAHHRTGGYGVAIHAGRKSWEEKFGTEAELLSQVLQSWGGLRMTNLYCEALTALRSAPHHYLKEVGDQWRTRICCSGALTRCLAR